MMTTPPKTLTRDQLLGYKPKQKTVTIPSLGGKVTVRQALVSDQEWVASKINDESSMSDLQALFFIRCSVNPDLAEDDFDAIKNLPADTLKEIDDAIEQASGGKVASAKEAEKSDLA